MSSPGYPLGYPPNTRCEWRLVVRPTATMTLSFRDMHIAGFAARRCRDTLTITSLISEGESKSTNETGEWSVGFSYRSPCAWMQSVPPGSRRAPHLMF